MRQAQANPPPAESEKQDARPLEPHGGLQSADTPIKMVGAEFAGGMDERLILAAELRTAIMCAEAVCCASTGRALIADELCVAGIKVQHVLGERHCVAHPLSSAARIVDGRLN